MKINLTRDEIKEAIKAYIFQTTKMNDDCNVSVEFDQNSADINIFIKKLNYSSSDIDPTISPEVAKALVDQASKNEATKPRRGRPPRSTLIESVKGKNSDSVNNSPEVTEALGISEPESNSDDGWGPPIPHEEYNDPFSEDAQAIAIIDDEIPYDDPNVTTVGQMEAEAKAAEEPAAPQRTLFGNIKK